MDLDVLPLRRIETVDRRILGAFRLVDAVTGLPLGVPAVVAVLGATINGVPLDAAVDRHTVQLRQNRRGIVVVFGAPLFDTYTSMFDNPVTPPQTVANPLRLRLAVASAGLHHLPRELTLDLPRALDPVAADSVLEAQNVALLRAPNANVQPGWAVLRARVTRAGVNPPSSLGAVLIRVFRSPRALADRPIGIGMTEWRGAVAGEALVAIDDIERFRPGAGANVIDTDLAIELEASRHATFTGVEGAVPDVDALIAGTGQGFIRPPTQPPGSQITVLQPATAPPMRVQAGREYVVHLAMP